MVLRAGKGVSSSAALEVSVMSAVATAHGIKLTGRELALLCQQVEVSHSMDSSHVGMVGGHKGVHTQLS